MRNRGWLADLAATSTVVCDAMRGSTGRLAVGSDARGEAHVWATAAIIGAGAGCSPERGLGDLLISLQLLTAARGGGCHEMKGRATAAAGALPPPARGEPGCGELATTGAGKLLATTAPRVLTATGAATASRAPRVAVGECGRQLELALWTASTERGGEGWRQGVTCLCPCVGSTAWPVQPSGAPAAAATIVPPACISLPQPPGCWGNGDPRAATGN